MTFRKRSLMISGGVILLLFVLYVGIFYYQHMRPGQRVDIPEQFATSTQTDAGDGVVATSTPDTPISAAPCRVSGCSNEVCSEGNLVSACIYRSEYACYKTATCARQSTGMCGWTETPELLACVAGKQSGGNVLTPQ